MRACSGFGSTNSQTSFARRVRDAVLFQKLVPLLARPHTDDFQSRTSRAGWLLLVTLRRLRQRRILIGCGIRVAHLLLLFSASLAPFARWDPRHLLHRSEIGVQQTLGVSEDDYGAQYGKLPSFLDRGDMVSNSQVSTTQY